MDMKDICFALNKRQYPTKELAEENAAYQERRQPALKLRIFKCTFCNMWHLTHRPKVTRRHNW